MFDKDGTLVDFHATWDPLILGLLERLADGDRDLLPAAAAVIGFDLAAAATRPDSPVIAGSNAELADLLAPVFGHRAGDPGFLARVEDDLLAAEPTAVIEVPGASAVLAALAAAGVALGLATNDSEASARAQLHHLGWTGHFGSVIGYDSGHGPKPEPGMVIASAAALGVPVARLAMVGDSLHDLHAARAAGAVAVLYGAGPELVDHADVVLASLAEAQGLVVSP